MVPEPPGRIPPPATEYLVKEAYLVNGAVKVTMQIPLTPAGRKPTLIAPVGNLGPLLTAGFVALTYTVNPNLLTPPAATPGPAEQSVGTFVLASPSAAVLGERYLRGIATTATEYVPAIIDWLSLQPQVDAARIGMAGGSTNGFIALQAAAADSRLRAVVALAACGDYHRFLRDSSMGMQGKPLELEPSYESWIRSQEIIGDPRRVVHAAVLMVNRAGDQLIPVACADETARVLQEAYAQAGAPQRFRYVRLEQPGHGIGTDEYGEMLAWFQQWLKPR